MENGNHTNCKVDTSPQPLKLDAKVNVPNSLILIGQVYLSGVWLGVDIITDTKIHVFK